MAQMKSVSSASTSNWSLHVGQAHLGQKRILLAHDHIHRHADQDRRRQVEELVENRTEHGQQDCAMVAGGIVPKTDKWMWLFLRGQELIPRLGIGNRTPLF